jgi:enoyl-CoA hydratase/carnithine racemase
MTDPVTLDIADGIARVVLNRPAQMNAVSPELLQALDAACATIEQREDARVVTLTGNGRAFCAGADLKVVQERAPDPTKWREFMTLWRRVFDRVERLPRPVIGGVHGLALAGGLELLLVCDLVVADAEAKIGDQHANFGLLAGGGGSQRLPRVIGPRRAKELMLLGGWITAEQALAWGLVNRVAPAGKLNETLMEMARELADKSVAASRAAKSLVNRALDVDLAAGLDLEAAEAGRHMRGADATEGLAAFVGKRKPVFRRS